MSVMTECLNSIEQAIAAHEEAQLPRQFSFRGEPVTIWQGGSTFGTFWNGHHIEAKSKKLLIAELEKLPPKPIPTEAEREATEKWFVELNVRKNKWLAEMATLGWWDLKEDESGDLVPVSKAKVVFISDFPENATMAHVMHSCGLFKSIGDARRNGWNRPIEVGVFTVGKLKTQIKIEAKREG